MKKFFRNNGLSICFLSLFILSMAGQWLTGHRTYNDSQIKEGKNPVSLSTYSTTGHFIQSTFENWESEFLQMALFVVLTIFLFQKGSSESKKIDEEEEVDREPSPNRKGAPGPVRAGGFLLKLYKHSLSIALFFLFIISFLLHFKGSLMDENEERLVSGLPALNAGAYIGESRFWFESFQNWQSEFLSVFTIVVLSIFLRQQGSPQSKPVDAPHDETGG
jgi:hypothetical protein